MRTFTLPTPRLTATILLPPEDAPPTEVGVVVVHGAPGWEERLAGVIADPPALRRKCHCTTCGKPGHNSRSRKCPGPNAGPPE